MAEKNIGKITQVIGAVLDIKFNTGSLPEINDAIKVPLKNGKDLTVEVAQHLGDDTVSLDGEITKEDGVSYSKLVINSNK